MIHPSPSTRPNSPARVFFRQWLHNPVGVASILPSGQQLARLMTDQLPAGSTRVVELGAGTGALTTRLLGLGLSAEELLVLELNQTLFEHLSERYPGVHAVCGDAVELAGIIGAEGFAGIGEVDAIVSSLGLLNMPAALQKKIVGAAFKALRPQGLFIQFTYSPAPPISSQVRRELGLAVRRAGFAWRNLPPASVFVFSRGALAPAFTAAP